MKPLSHDVTYYLVKALAGFARILPVGVCGWLARRVGDLIYLFHIERREIAINNLSRAFGKELKRPQIRRIARKSFQHMVVSVVELFTAERIKATARQRFHIKGEAILRQAFQRGKGVVFVISHLGAWEYLSFSSLLMNYEYSYSVVVKEIKNPRLDQEINRLRRAIGVLPIPKKRAARKILGELRNNHGVAILIDQWAGLEGVWLPFFGHSTSTTTLPARLALKTGCALVPAYCLRREDGRYDIELGPLIEIDGVSATAEIALTEKLNRLLEEKIRQYPHQWLWCHRRWKPKIMVSSHQEFQRQTVPFYRQRDD